MVLVITLYSILLTSYEDNVTDKQLCLTCISSLNKVYYYIIIIRQTIPPKRYSDASVLYFEKDI